MLDWLIFFQTPYNNVKFITNEDDSYQVLKYQKFKDFIAQYKVEDRGNLIKHLDCFHTVLLKCREGTWEEIKPEIKEATFDEMLKLNPGEEEIREQKKKEDPVLSKKEFIKSIFQFKKDKSKKK